MSAPGGSAPTRLRARVRELEAEVAGLQALLAHDADLREADLVTAAVAPTS